MRRTELLQEVRKMRFERRIAAPTIEFRREATVPSGR